MMPLAYNMINPSLLLERTGESSTHASPTSFLNYATHHYVEMLHQNKNGQLSVAQISPASIERLQLSPIFSDPNTLSCIQIFEPARPCWKRKIQTCFRVKMSHKPIVPAALGPVRTSSSPASKSMPCCCNIFNSVDFPDPKAPTQRIMTPFLFVLQKTTAKETKL